MYGQSKASTIEDYISGLDEPRRSDIASLDKLIRQTTPSLKPTMTIGIPGYGPYHYKYASGREGDWTVVSLASNKNYISLYVVAMTEKGYLAESYRDKLPKASIGKSCIRFKRLTDVDMEVLKEILRKAQEWHKTVA